MDDVHTDNSMCVETHLDGESKHLHLNTRTITSHAQRQMRRNSFAGVGVWLVLGSHAGYLHQWRLAAVVLKYLVADGFPLLNLSCNHLADQRVAQVLKSGQEIHN